MKKPSLQSLTAGHVRQVQHVQRDLLEKAMALRCEAYLADAKAQVLIRTVSTIGESKRELLSTHERLAGVTSELREVTRLVEQAPVMTATLVNGELSFRNQAFLERFGPEGPPSGPGGASLWNEIYLAAERGDSCVLHGELVGLTGGFRAKVTLVPLPGTHLVPVMGVYVDDTTWEHTAYMRLAQSERLRALGRLSAGVAHDINNVLSVVGVTAELLRDCEWEERQPLLDDIAEVVESAAALGRSLVSAGQGAGEVWTLVDVCGRARGASALLQRAIGPVVDLSVEAPDDPLVARCSPEALDAALLNLLLNARDACKTTGGRVQLTVSAETIDRIPVTNPSVLQPGEYIRLSVSDDGVGVDGSVRDRLFEPFTSGASGSSGMGLAMVLGFATRNGGGVHWEPRPEGGTVFDIYLPRVPASAIGEAPCVILVDDNELVRKTLANSLRARGMEVRALGTAQEALTLLSAAVGDVLVTDVVLGPYEDGVSLALKAQRLRPGLPVVLVTGYSGIEALHVAEEHSLPVLFKPFKIERLVDAIRGSLARVRALR